MQEFGEVKFRDDRVKIQIWGKPAFMLISHLSLQCVYICKWASTMILLFDMWTENVAYHDGEIEPRSSLSGQ